MLSLLKGCDNYDDFQIPDDSDCRDCSAFAFYFEYDQEEKIRIKVFPGLAYCIGIFADYGNDARKTSGDSNGSWYIFTDKHDLFSWFCVFPGDYFCADSYSVKAVGKNPAACPDCGNDEPVYGGRIRGWGIRRRSA